MTFFVEIIWLLFCTATAIFDEDTYGAVGGNKLLFYGLL